MQLSGCNYCWWFKHVRLTRKYKQRFSWRCLQSSNSFVWFSLTWHCLPSVQCLSRIEPVVPKLFHVFEFCSFSCLFQTREGPPLWIYNDIFCVVGIQCLHRTENTPCCCGISKNHGRFSLTAFHLFGIRHRISVQWGIIRLAKMEE